MNIRCLGIPTAALATFLLLGCEDQATQPDALTATTEEPMLGKGNGKGRGGGGDGGPGATYSLTFVDPAGPSDPSLRLFSDGTGPYTDAITVARQFVFDPEGPEPICVRFTDDQETTGAGVPGDLADDLDPTGKVCLGGDLRTVWHSNDDLGLEAMSVGQPIRAEARYIWTDGENNQFKLEFFCRDDRGGDDGATACPDLLDVALIADEDGSRTWNLTFDAALEAVLSRNFVKGKPNPFEPLAAFHMPFDLTVTRID